MTDFKKSGGFQGNRGNDRGGNRFGDKPRFGGKPSFGNKGGFRNSDDRGGFGNRPPVQLFRATCAQCGKACEVPFRPTGEKPVYCNTCFAGSKGRGGFGKGDRFRGAPDVREASKPQIEDKRIDDIKRQLDTAQSKLNDILQLLTAYKIDEVIKQREESPKKKSVVSKKKTVAKKK